MAQMVRNKRPLLKLLEKAKPAYHIVRPHHLKQRRRKRITIPKSQEQKREERAKREERREEYLVSLGGARSQVVSLVRKLQADFPGHTLQYYINDITQTRAEKPERSINIWNCFIHEEMKAINDALPEDAPRRRSSDPEVTQALHEKWVDLNKAHSKEELREKYKEALSTLTASRDARKYGTHNRAIAAFHDVRSTLASINLKLNDLYARTDYETILIGARQLQEAYETPMVFVTSCQGTQFLQSQLKAGAGADAGIIFEGFLAQGLQGTVDNHIKTLAQMKTAVAQLIASKLEQCLGGVVKKIFYTDFDNKMTRSYGVTIVGWPLERFCCPGDIRVMNELQVLENAWKSGATYWKKLSPTEYEAFVAGAGNECHSPPLTGTDSPGEVSNGSTPAASVNSPSIHASTGNPTSALGQIPIDPAIQGDPATQAQPMNTSTAVPTQVSSGTVTNAVGQPVQREVKQRKKRSDAGKKRGPRKNVTAA